MINSRTKSLLSRKKNRKFPVSRKFLRMELSAEEFYSSLRSSDCVDIDSIIVGMSYNVRVNNCKYDEKGKVSAKDISFFTTTAVCTEIKKFGDEVLYAKFNLKGGSTLVKGNYGLIYYCTSIMH